MAFKQTGDISSDGHTAFFRGVVPASLEGDVIAIYPFHSEGVFDLSQQSGILDKMKVTDVMKAEGSLSGNRISKLSFQPLTTIIRIPAETIYPESGIEGQVAFSFSGASVGNKITVSPSGTISVEAGSVTFPAMLSNSSFVTDVAFNFIPKTSGLDELEYSLQREGGNPYSFSRKSIDVGKMYNLKRFEDPWEFVISARDPDDLSWSGGISESAHVLSYKERNGVQIPVGWSIEGYYSDEECTASLTQPAWITAITTQGSGSVSEGETLSITYSTGNAIQSSRTDLAEIAYRHNFQESERPVEPAVRAALPAWAGSPEAEPAALVPGFAAVFEKAALTRGCPTPESYRSRSGPDIPNICAEIPGPGPRRG